MIQHLGHRYLQCASRELEAAVFFNDFPAQYSHSTHTHHIHIASHINRLHRAHTHHSNR